MACEQQAPGEAETIRRARQEKRGGELADTFLTMPISPARPKTQAGAFPQADGDDFKKV